MVAAFKPRIRPPAGAFPTVKSTVASLGLATVCEEARCPNLAGCWSSGTATFMVLGDVCTRACKFCHVKTFYRGRPVDPEEPRRLGAAVRALGLEHVVITSVDRDDLADQGAGHLAACVREVKGRCPGVAVEVLIPDFRGDPACLRTVLLAGPDVLAHNLETVERLQSRVRDPRAGYRQSLGALKLAKELEPAVVTKSSLMLGLGETDREVIGAMKDLRAAGVELLTLGQYLRPSLRHLPVADYVPAEKWEFFRMVGEDLGFAGVFSGPLVRSSYRAGELLAQAAHR